TVINDDSKRQFNRKPDKNEGDKTMSQSEKSQEKTPKTEPKKALDLEELGSVNGGTFMANSCSDRDTPKCIGDPYKCKASSDNKRYCTFG
ncbi:MAG TPA: hypothetical protein VN381_08055, partial [Anaerovoracaceae bacterium]|nr:hypothetical protein [Anaerovoracaceae bacterium]